MITEKTLKKWRKEALETTGKSPMEAGIIVTELSKRILRMTQELFDLHLIRKK